MNFIRRIWQTIWESYRVGLFVVVVALILTILTPRFLQAENLLNVLTNASVTAIVGLGMTLAIASGNFDLSVGSVAAFAGSISMSLVPTIGIPGGIAAGLLAGALVGLVNGLIITELRVPAFIATLGMLTIVRGLTLIYTGGRDIYLSFVDDKVIVALPYKKDLFEPHLFRSIIDYPAIEAYFSDLQFVLSLVGDLNLNTRIWGKE